MNKILVVLGCVSALFIALCFLFVWHDKLIPDSLIVSYFSAVGTEGAIMGWIKNVKEKNYGNNK